MAQVTKSRTRRLSRSVGFHSAARSVAIGYRAPFPFFLSPPLSLTNTEPRVQRHYGGGEREGEREGGNRDSSFNSSRRDLKFTNSYILKYNLSSFQV